MKGKILLFTGLLLVGIFLLAPVSHAQIEWSKSEPVHKKTIDGVEYGWKKLPSGNNCAIVHIKVKKKKKTVRIPSSITGYKVVYLGCHDKKNNLWGKDYSNYPEAGVLQESNVSTIVIPESVKEIGKGTFSMVKGLRRVVLPDYLEAIPKDAFSNCANLRCVELGIKTKRIATGAFLETAELEQVKIPEGNFYFSVKYGYLLTKNDTEIALAIPAETKGDIPSTVTTILPMAFWNTSRLEVHIPGTISKICPQGLSTKTAISISIADNNDVYAKDKGSIYEKQTGCLVGNVVQDGVADVHSWKVTMVDGLISSIGGNISVIRYPITLVRLKKQWTQCASVVEFRTLIPPSVVEGSNRCFANTYVYPAVASIQYEDVLEKANALVNPVDSQVAKKELRKYKMWELIDQIKQYFKACLENQKKN